MKAHPIADKLPMLSELEHAQLVDSMRTYGFDPSHPILVLDGQILDGRNRWKAAEEAGVQPVLKDWSGGNPWEFVWRENAIRRQIEPGRKACAARLFLEGSETWEDRKKRGAAGRPKGSSNSDKGGLKTPLSNGSNSKKRADVAAKAAVSEATAKRALALPAAVVEDVATGKIEFADAVREMKRKKVVAQLEDVSARDAKAAAGVYDTIVIDPPWPMEKIERDVRPNQTEFDYPTMSEDELRSLQIPCAEACHVWLWTTHKFLPMAFRLLDDWGLKYVCTFVWHKPGGFQPIGLPQYNCEFALYARKGAPVFLDTKAFPTCFEADRGAHSEKPEDFYEVVRRVTGGRRLDMFNRRLIEGFDRWGKEAA